MPEHHVAEFTDTEAMNFIQELLDGNEWGIHDIEDIAQAVRQTGRSVDEFVAYDDEEM